MPGPVPPQQAPTIHVLIPEKKIQSLLSQQITADKLKVLGLAIWYGSEERHCRTQAAFPQLRRWSLLMQFSHKVRPFS